MKTLLSWFKGIIKRILDIGLEMKSVISRYLASKFGNKTDINADINELLRKSPRMPNGFVRFLFGQRRFSTLCMPKRQPCPECHGWRKRERKTVAGAFYNCTHCKNIFFVVNQSAATAQHLGRLVAGVT